MFNQDNEKKSDKEANYKITSEQLDNFTSTVITALLSGFIVAQKFLGENANHWYKAAAVFALFALLFHYISYITAHFAQIYSAKGKDQLYEYFSQWTIRLNFFVYLLVVVEFVISILLIIF